MNKSHCYTSQLKFVSWLEENVSRVVGQNSLTPQGEQNSLIPQGNNKMNFRLARDQVVLLETREILLASRRKTNDRFLCSFLYLWVEGITKHLLIAPRATVSFDSPRPLFCCREQLYLSTASLLFSTVSERDLGNLPVKFWATRRFVLILKQLDHPLDLYAWCLTFAALSSTITS